MGQGVIDTRQSPLKTSYDPEKPIPEQVSVLKKFLKLRKNKRRKIR